MTDVSIIVPCYNGMRTLTACIDSLTRLAPASPPHEILVVDNGSTDGSLEAIAARPEVRLVKEHAVRGPAAARNAGARLAEGTILAFTDIDCVVTPSWLVESLPAFAAPEVVGVGGAIEGVRPKNRIQAWMNSRKILDQERALAHPFRPYLQTANALFRREAFQRVGGFDPRLYCGEDCDLSWRVQQETGGTLAYRPQALVFHDHRCSLRGLFRQSKKNAMGGAHLALKWRDGFPPKTLKQSVWECWGILRGLGRFLGSALVEANAPRTFDLRLDLLHRFARKLGMIESAWQTGQWSQW
jgi:GT2 family glycosyltransferase